MKVLIHEEFTAIEKALEEYQLIQSILRKDILLKLHMLKNLVL